MLSRHSSGFTLLELMVTVAVAAVILGLGVPNLREFLWNNWLTSAANDFVVALTVARSEAIKARLPTIVCFSADPNAATPACDGNAAQGWVVFEDANGDASSDGERIILRHGALAGSLSLRAQPSGNAGYVAFAGSGFSRTTTLGTPLTGLVLCDSRGNTSQYGPEFSTARGVVISPTGRPRVTRSVAEISGATLGGCP